MRNVGDLKERVRLYRRNAQIQDGSGHVTYELIGSFAAEVLKQSDTTFAEASAEYLKVLKFVTIRTPRSFSPAPMMQVEHKGDRYEVVEAIPDTPLPGFTRLRCVLVQMGSGGIE